ncbi:hypothetical protein [Paenibacillus aceti]|uniref:Uncharacterized protein n=1 Tax=Paenibacillus aceti TaxID=1820010 RepID=A0ABQ1W263_9BACL|nr:hypothetical protein [Paenibacillus aceti]GGG07706.1 hypothetical protein GCM10010913_31890 [Paenibacillus aceti]
MNEVRRKRKRRKKSRKPLWITLIVLVVLVGGGYGGYYYISHRDIQAADIGVEQDFFDFSDFGDLDSVLSGDPDDTAKGEKDGQETSGNATSEQNGQEPSTDGSQAEGGKSSNAKDSTHSDAPKDEKKRIEDKYSKVFKKLESTALSKLDTLAENALQDYRTGRSLADLSSTYMSAANKLQSKVDSTFNSLLDQMKDELKEAGLDNELATKAESEYKQAIANKKSEMMKKVTKVSGK